MVTYNKVIITKADVHRLYPTQYLNDSIIEFYLKCVLVCAQITAVVIRSLCIDCEYRYCFSEMCPPPLREQVTVFNTFFYRKLCRGGYSEVR